MEKETYKGFSPTRKAILTWLFTILLGSGALLFEMIVIKSMAGWKNEAMGFFFFSLFYSAMLSFPSVLVLWLMYSCFRHVMEFPVLRWSYLVVATGLVNLLVVLLADAMLGRKLGRDLQSLILPYVIVSFPVVLLMNRKLLQGTKTEPDGN